LSPKCATNNKGIEMQNFKQYISEATKDVPVMVFGDMDASVAAKAEKMGLGEEWVRGDPMKAPNLDAVVSPANTVGEMSGGYDLVIRNKLGMGVQQKAMKSLEKMPLVVLGPLQQELCLCEVSEILCVEFWCLCGGII